MRSISRADEIIESIRAALSAGYVDQQDLRKKAAQQTRDVCVRLQRREAQEMRALFVAVLEMPLGGTCVPECCDASWIRALQIAAKCDVLTTWRKLDPEVVEEMRPALLADLLVPNSKRIAMAAMELLERAPAACTPHFDMVLGALEHPRWQVAEGAARLLGRMEIVANKRAVEALTNTLRHSQWQVRKAAAKSLGRMVKGPHERLMRLSERDPHPGVRYACCKALGIKRDRAGIFPGIEKLSVPKRINH